MSFDGFTDGARSAGSIVANDAGPLDIICSKIRELLAANATLSTFFKAIQRYDARPDSIFGGLPQLHVYPGAFDPSRRATETIVGDFEVVISLRSEFGSLKPLDDFEVGWSGIIMLINKILDDNTQLADTVGGASVVLCRKSTHGPYSVAIDIEPDGRRRAISREISRICSLTIDDNTGQLEVFS